MKTLLAILCSLFAFFATAQSVVKVGDQQIPAGFVIDKDSLFYTDQTGEIFCLVNGNKQGQDYNDIAHNQELKGVVFALDKLPDTDKILLVSHGERNFSNLWLLTRNKLQQILFDEKDRISLFAAYMIDTDRALLCTRSNEMIMLNLQTKKVAYKRQLSQSLLSASALSEDRRFLACGDEAGCVRVVDVADGRVVRFHRFHKDKVLSLDYDGQLVISGGEDRKICLYDQKTNSVKSFGTSFFPYAVALDYAQQKLAYMSTDDCRILVRSFYPVRSIKQLVGHQSIVLQMKFFGKHQLVSFSSEALKIWNI